jgi:hypothetical protein
MSTIAGECINYNAKSGKRDRIRLEARVTIGAAGAIGSQETDDPGLVVSKNAGTGVYDLVFPKAPKGSMGPPAIVSPAGTVKSAWIVSFSATLGTAQVAIGNGGGTATNPATSDVLVFELQLEMRSDA